ncbi:hypothetical protein [Sphingomonas oryzagri]|uniref:Uncharacterized protein n=1 Tax=Sphingomonas oryzagri TaxID=3042314 RepID=A0ABT6N3U2_9SPHN|nr:hypothetical protein [Sphingomonas oryzagri]MDH7639969.1 hypothetical protein [Sphingomonas oryzagri]
MNDAEALAAEIRSAATSAGSHLVAAPLHTERSAYPTVLLSTEEIVRLVIAVRPAIIYAVETTLDPAVEVEAAIEEIGAEPDDDASTDIRRAGKPLAAHDGDSARTTVEFVAGGVLHAAYAEAAWITEFEREVEAISLRVADQEEAGERLAGKETAAHIRALAERLLSDPAFDGGRPSFAKRRFLAGELFPDEDDHILGAVTEMAENLRWLAAGRT